jgi:hypothetical protein
VWVLGYILWQEFERDEATKLGVLSLVDDTIPPPPSFSTMR